jgi:hypothetical protein
MTKQLHHPASCHILPMAPARRHAMSRLEFLGLKGDPAGAAALHAHVNLHYQRTCCWYQWLYLMAIRAYDQSLASSTPFTCAAQHSEFNTNMHCLHQ